MGVADHRRMVRRKCRFQRNTWGFLSEVCRICPTKNVFSQALRSSKINSIAIDAAQQINRLNVIIEVLYPHTKLMAALSASDASWNDRGIKLILVDDHRLMREGLRRILEGQPDLDVVGETDDGHQALQLIRELGANVAVIDMSMPGLSGVNLIRRIRQESPRCAVLVLSMYAEELYAMRALKAGAQGYVNKDSATEELVRAVRKVAVGGCYLSSGMAEKVAMSLTHQDDTPRHDRLTDREFEIFRRIVGGQRVSDISRAIHLSIKTVSTHKSRILQKMQLDSTAALIRYGLEHRLFADGGSLDETHDHEPRPMLGTTQPAAAAPRQSTFTF